MSKIKSITENLMIETENEWLAKDGFLTEINATRTRWSQLIEHTRNHEWHCNCSPCLERVELGKQLLAHSDAEFQARKKRINDFIDAENAKKAERKAEKDSPYFQKTLNTSKPQTFGKIRI